MIAAFSTANQCLLRRQGAISTSTFQVLLYEALRICLPFFSHRYQNVLLKNFLSVVLLACYVIGVQLFEIAQILVWNLYGVYFNDIIDSVVSCLDLVPALACQHSCRVELGNIVTAICARRQDRGRPNTLRINRWELSSKRSINRCGSHCELLLQLLLVNLV